MPCVPDLEVHPLGDQGALQICFRAIDFDKVVALLHLHTPYSLPKHILCSYRNQYVNYIIKAYLDSYEFHFRTSQISYYLTVKFSQPASSSLAFTEPY